MKTESRLWLFVMVFYGVIAVIYKLVGGEPGGVALLAIAAAFGGLIAGWTWRWSHQHSPDKTGRTANENADTADVVGAVGVFPSASLRPLGIGAAMTLIAAGWPLGSWMFVAGLALLASQIGLIITDRDR